MGAAALAAAWHPAALLSTSASPTVARQPLIRSMRLRTSAPLDLMRDFYGSTLGLRTSPVDKGAFTLFTRGTEVSFAGASSGSKKIHYHFAFNIPQNQIRQALDWAKSRVALIPAWGNLGDAAYPKEIIHFRHWNAKSIFFFDPAYNLVEFIARHELKNDESGKFSSTSLLCASEIGLPTNSPEATAKTLHKDLGLLGYPSGTPPQFAMGDANGLLLCLLDSQVWGEHTKTPIRWGRHPVDLTVSGTSQRAYTVEGYPYTIKVERHEPGVQAPWY